MTAEGPPDSTGFTKVPAFPEAADHPGEHYHYTYADVRPTAWTQVCQRCGHRRRINAPNRPGHAPQPPSPLAARAAALPRVPHDRIPDMTVSQPNGKPVNRTATLPETRAHIRGLKARFPAATCWYGTHTGSWWAILPGLPRLIEAPNPAALAHALAAAVAAFSTPGDLLASAPPRPHSLPRPRRRLPPNTVRPAHPAPPRRTAMRSAAAVAAN